MRWSGLVRKVRRKKSQVGCAGLVHAPPCPVLSNLEWHWLSRTGGAAAPGSGKKCKSAGIHLFLGKLLLRTCRVPTTSRSRSWRCSCEESRLLKNPCLPETYIGLKGNS